MFFLLLYVAVLGPIPSSSYSWDQPFFRVMQDAAGFQDSNTNVHAQVVSQLSIVVRNG